MLEVGTSRKTEIRQLDMVVLVDKDVVCFDVPESRNKYGDARGQQASSPINETEFMDSLYD